MRMIIFGVGNYFRERKHQLKDLTNVEIVAFTDNNKALWNMSIDNISIISPDLIKTQEYDIILIMSTYIRQIYKQLVDLGINKSKIIEWERFWNKYHQGDIKVFCSRKRVLIISQELNYDGGSMTAVYAAQALIGQGMAVILAVPGGNSRLIDEVISTDITVVMCPTLPYIYETEKKWICQFDIVLVNLFTMAESACEISTFRPVLWWIHEASLIYEPFMKKSIRFIDQCELSRINIYAVSRIAENNFRKHVGDFIKKNLIPGFPDKAQFLEQAAQKDKRLVFAIIGTVYSLKGQDIFLKSIFDVKQKEQAEYWIIGKLDESDYCNMIRERQFENVSLLGEMTRRQLNEAFSNIDVVVCASTEETLSLTIVEAMMYGKLCIVTENTGIAEYIQDGINGFIIPVNDIQALTEKIGWVIENRSEVDRIGQAARKIYEDNFTMEAFGERLATALNESILEWKNSDSQF